MKPPPVILPEEMRGLSWAVKDLARYMGISTRQVRKWWKVLKVRPDVCARHGCHRWSAKAAQRLFTKWRGKWSERGEDAGEAVAKFAGVVKRCREKRQLLLPIYAKEPPAWSVLSQQR